MALILDFDDTLVDTSRRLHAALGRVSNEPLSWSEFVRYRMEGCRIREIATDVLGLNWAQVEAEFVGYVEDIDFLRLDRPLVDKERLLRLKHVHGDLAVCSIRNSRVGLLTQIDGLGWGEGLFSEVVVVNRSMDGASKVDALRVFCKKFDGVTFVGDSADDRTSAQLAGVPFVNAVDGGWVNILLNA